jgi:hypothetical protein
MHIETFLYKCGCLGELRAMYDTTLTNREKVELRRRERSLCPDCYQQQVEDKFVAQWGALPELSGVTSKQEAFGNKVALQLLASGQVRPELGKLLLSRPGLPASALLDVYTQASLLGKPQSFPGMSGAENILLSAFPSVRTAYFAAFPPVPQPLAPTPASVPEEQQDQSAVPTPPSTNTK